MGPCPGPHKLCHWSWKKLTFIEHLICPKHFNEWSPYHSLINLGVSSLEHPVFNKLLWTNIVIIIYKGNWDLKDEVIAPSHTKPESEPKQCNTWGHVLSGRVANLWTWTQDLYWMLNSWLCSYYLLCFKYVNESRVWIHWIPVNWGVSVIQWTWLMDLNFTLDDTLDEISSGTQPPAFWISDSHLTQWWYFYALKLEGVLFH